MEVEASRNVSGNYTCRARYGKLYRNDTIKADIKYRPEPKDSDNLLRNITITEGSSGLLLCEMIGEPKPKIKWTIITSSDNKTNQIESDKIKIDKMSIANIGTYTCIGENSEGVSNSSLVYHVEMATASEPTVVDFMTKVIHVNTGNDIQINCVCIECAPLTKYSWTFKNKLNESESTLQDAVLNNSYYDYVDGRKRRTSYSLSLKNVSDTDEGSYECLLENEHGMDKKSVMLKVIGK